MSDHRLVQCFGVKKQPRKPDEPCRKRWLWSAAGATKHRFGRNGTICCPNCGTSPDFRHPFNKYLNGEMSEEEAKSRMPDYVEILKKEKK